MTITIQGMEKGLPVNIKDINRWLNNSYVGIPTVVGALLLSILLLISRDPDAGFRQWLIPSLIVYVLGTSLLLFVYAELDARNCLQAKKDDVKPGPQPWWITWIIWTLHGLWLGTLIVYLACKSVL